jgi:hypothetical protein
MTPDDLAQAATVQRWFVSARYDRDPPEEQQERYVLLGAFCDHTGQSPDELVQGLFRTTKDGNTAISAKKREAMNATIQEFVEKSGLAGKEAVMAGNSIRGFLIHNGVFIQGPVWRG